MESQRFSVIVPTLNEARNIGRTVKRIRELSAEAEIIVCDGESVDGTPDQAEKLGVRVVCSLRGGEHSVMQGQRRHPEIFCSFTMPMPVFRTGLFPS